MARPVKYPISEVTSPMNNSQDSHTSAKLRKATLRRRLQRLVPAEKTGTNKTEGHGKKGGRVANNEGAAARHLDLNRRDRVGKCRGLVEIEQPIEVLHD